MQVFSCEYCLIFMVASAFFLKVIKHLFYKGLNVNRFLKNMLWRPNNFFFSTHLEAHIV